MSTAGLIALGASNLTRILPRLVAHERERVGGPLRVLTACGFGRSYGIGSRFLARALPGIDTCGLWPALARSSPTPATGVVMDVGNDLLYGIEVPQILAWVQRALERLAPHVNRLVVAGLPPGLDRISEMQFAFIRRVLVPGCHLSRAEALARAEALDAGLRELAVRRRAEFVQFDPSCYGFDPMHVRRRCHDDAARTLLQVAPAPPPATLRLTGLVAAERSVFGKRQTAVQPSVRLADGTTVAAY